jgi:hypothetical protein
MEDPGPSGARQLVPGTPHHHGTPGARGDSLRSRDGRKRAKTYRPAQHEGGRFQLGPAQDDAQQLPQDPLTLGDQVVAQLGQLRGGRGEVGQHGERPIEAAALHADPEHRQLADQVARYETAAADAVAVGVISPAAADRQRVAAHDQSLPPDRPS